MKWKFLGTFLLGVTSGIGLTILCLFAQKPECFVDSVESVAQMGRARREKREERILLRRKLRAMGFTDEEIRENL
jgi:hypothetical protein